MHTYGGTSDALGGTDFSSLLITIAVVALLAQVLFWLAYFRFRYGSRQWLLRLVDVDSYPVGSALEVIKEAIGERLGSAAIEPSTVVSPTRKYRLAEALPGGDLCDVYRAESRNGLAVLKIPRVTLCGRLIAKEQMILRQIRDKSAGTPYRKYFPNPIEAFQVQGRVHSALRWRDGYFTAEQIRGRHRLGLDARHLGWMFNRTLEALGFVHRLGWIHGSVLPPHLLFHTGNHGLQLIGWTHAVPVDTPLEIVSRRYKSWYPPACHAREPSAPATDIFLAVKSMIYLAGGDPLADEIPDHVPIEMAAFFRECLSMTRVDHTDAWKLHEQFRQLLENLYGPPRFCHLTMS